MNVYIKALFIFASLSSSYGLCATSIVVDNRNGLFNIKGEVGLITHSSYVGWSKGWKWDAPKVVERRISSNVEKKFQLKFHKQAVNSVVEIKSEINHLKYVYYHKFTKSLQNTIGGGIEFKLDLQAQIRNFDAKEPKLLKNNSGWSWEFKPGKTIEVKFSPSIARVYFEKGNKSKIRAMFFSGTVSPETSRLEMQVTVPKDTFITPFSNTKQLSQHSSWLRGAVSPIELFVDLSKLNEKPAGNHGFVKSIGDKFLFEDGTPIHFYGTNVQAYSLFVRNKSLIKQHAKRIAKLGFNLVRLHHHDSSWVNQNLISKGETTQGLNEKALDSYYWWIKCLRDEGIYVWLDLQVQRPWRKGDNISGWRTDLAPKAKKGKNVAKGFVYLNERMQELTKKFNTELLTRVNPYTKLALKDDPAVMGMMVTNENDLTHHFGNSFLKNKKHPYHQMLFDKEVETFADKFNFPAYKVRETWKPGYSKYLLNDLEARFNEEMIKHLRSLGVKVPIATTSMWGRNSSLFSIPALTTGDVVDAHGYAGSDVFKKSLLQKDPNYTPNFLHSLGQGQVAGKPFTVTEYNVGQRFDKNSAYIPAVSVATMSAFQGWDAIMLYGYSQDGLRGWGASPWSSYIHPAIIGVVPAMALLYRQGHVAQANKTVVLAPANDDIFTKNLSPKTSAAIRTALEQHRMVVAMPKIKVLPWLKSSVIEKDANIIRDLNKNLLPANQNYIETDTGEVRRNWRTGIMTVNTPKSQLAMGHIGEHIIKLADVTIKSRTPEAAIIFTSLDNKPIKKSEKILVSAVAKVEKIKVKWKSTYISEPVKAKIIFSSKHKELNLVALRPNGSEGKSEILKSNKNGNFSFVLSEKEKTHWYIIKK